MSAHIPASQNVGYEPSDEHINELIETHPGGMNLDEIAEELHCTKQRAKQLLDRALLKVVNALAHRGIRSMDDAPC